MALSHSPSIVNDGLLAYVDPANSKCFTNSENLLTYSDDYSNAVWNKYSGQTTVTTSQYTDPINTSTADLITTPSDTGTHQGITTVVGLPYTASVYILLGVGTSATSVMFRDQGGAGHHIVFNTSSRAITQQANITNHGVIDVGGGWYRFWMTYVATATSGLLTIRPDGQAGTTNMMLWGMQFENGTLPSDYISTTASIVNRSRTPIDLSGNGRTVTLHPAVATGPCAHYNPVAKSLVFDGIDDYMSIGDFSYPAAWTNPLTLSIWINVPAAATWANVYRGNIFTRGTYDGAIGIVTRPTDGSISMFLRSDVGQISEVIASGIARNTWYNLVGVWTGTQLQLYVNTTLINTTTPATTAGVPEATQWQCGSAAAFSGGTGLFLNAQLSGAMIYNRALTAGEVRQNFNAMRGRYGI